MKRIMISNRKVKIWFLYCIFKILVFLIDEVENTLTEFRPFDGYLICSIFFLKSWDGLCFVFSCKTSPLYRIKDFLIPKLVKHGKKIMYGEEKKKRMCVVSLHELYVWIYYLVSDTWLIFIYPWITWIYLVVSWIVNILCIILIE